MEKEYELDILVLIGLVISRFTLLTQPDSLLLIVCGIIGIISLVYFSYRLFMVFRNKGDTKK